MITVEFWQTTHQWFYDPGVPSESTLVDTHKFKYKWMAKFSRWFWEGRYPNLRTWSKVIDTTTNKNTQEDKQNVKDK